jgi:hypothetical protein
MPEVIYAISLTSIAITTKRAKVNASKVDFPLHQFKYQKAYACRRDDLQHGTTEFMV